MLAGHTHGGQLWPAHLGVYMANQGRVAGLFDVGSGRRPGQAHRASADDFREMALYVGEGAVGWGPRLRLWSRTELTLVKLVQRREGADTEDGGHSSQLAAVAATWMFGCSLLYCVVAASCRFFAARR